MTDTVVPTTHAPFKYDTAWFNSLNQYREWNERAMWAALAHLGRAESMLDLGCGDAWMVRTARMTGAKPSVGIEVSQDARRLGVKWASILVRDLSEPLELNRRFDLVVSIEVGEHLPEDKANVYCDTIANHAAKWVVFTAAAPDQGGEGHINCQPQEYWREKLVARGLTYRLPETEQLKQTWVNCTGPMFWLPSNLQVFRRDV